MKIRVGDVQQALESLHFRSLSFDEDIVMDFEVVGSWVSSLVVEILENASNREG